MISVESWASTWNSLSSTVPYLYNEGLDSSPMSFPAQILVVQSKEAPELARVFPTLSCPHDTPLGPLGSAMVLRGAWHLHPISPLCPQGS